MSFNMQPSFLSLGVLDIQCFPNCMILTEVYVLTHERLRGNNGKCLRNSSKSGFSHNEIYHATEFSEFVIFKCSSVLRIAYF